MTTQATDRNGADSSYRSLFRIGGAAALIVALLSVMEVIAFIVHPPPATVREWFTLFEARPIVALIDFWGLEVPMYAMFALVFLALYFSLRSRNPSAMAIALSLALVGVAIFFATNNPFSMASLSRLHSAATDDAQRSAVLAAGEAVLANTNQRAVGGYNSALFFVSIAGLIVSSAMLHSRYLRRPTAYLGMLAFGLSLADFFRQILTASVTIALFVILPGALLLVIWFVVVGRRLLQLGN
jgi:hypothetical protein